MECVDSYPNVPILVWYLCTTERSPVPLHGQNIWREVQGFKPPLSKTWDNTKKFYYSLVTQEKVLLMKREAYFAKKWL